MDIFSKLTKLWKMLIARLTQYYVIIPLSSCTQLNIIQQNNKKKNSEIVLQQLVNLPVSQWTDSKLSPVQFIIL